MIETEQSVLVNAAIDDVWAHVSDISRWAAIMPGYRACEIIDANESSWTLKVGVGGLVRTVKVLVRVDEWAGPGLVRFSYRLANDPVKGSGTYHAAAANAGETDITLAIHVESSGPMAAMWEAMGKPLLPQFARSFADQLKEEIEKSAGVARPDPVDGGLLAWLARLWRRITG